MVLTHLCLVDSPILLNWINLFPKLGMSGIFISVFRIFLTEIPLSKQRRPWWDAASCGVSSGSTLFAKAFFLDARHKWVKSLCVSIVYSGSLQLKGAVQQIGKLKKSCFIFANFRVCYDIFEEIVILTIYNALKYPLYASFDDLKTSKS